MKAYKLLRLKRGHLYPLFIGRQTPTPVGVWVQAQCIPTPGYTVRPGWHCTAAPYAPHLRTRDGYIAEDRVWCEVELEDYYTMATPKLQGNQWLIAQRMKVVRVLDHWNLAQILINMGLSEHIYPEARISGPLTKEAA